MKKCKTINNDYNINFIYMLMKQKVRYLERETQAVPPKWGALLNKALVSELLKIN